jgi:hypothetical protein
MAPQIIVDQETGIIRLIHKNIVQNHNLWGASHRMMGKMDGTKAPRILADMRGAVIQVDEWESREFAEAHRDVFMDGTKIAILIQAKDPQKKDLVYFTRMFGKSGVNLRIFDNEFAAEEWLLDKS